MERHPPAYLSPSRLSCYAYCPAEFRKRYILKQDDPPTPERLFGTAVHKGLEALFTGSDEELAFLREWRAAKQALSAAEVGFGAGLDHRGLELLEMVRRLNLQGVPEQRITVTYPGIPLPIIGYTDLWDSISNTIYDFKTAGYGWTQEKANDQVFQPAIYSQAFADLHGVIPTFTFVVLPRIPGSVHLFDGTRTGDQILEAFDRVRVILDAIDAGQFDCTCERHVEAVA